MPLDADLLGQARTAENRLLAAEHDAEVARAEFRQALQELHRAGASEGEIAYALDMSRQRVRQLVEPAAGRRGWRKGHPGSGDLLSCSFCGKHQKQIQKLIAGPGVYICNECTELVHRVLTVPSSTATTPIATIGQVSTADRAELCSFCGKPRYLLTAMASAGGASICNECLELCDEIISEELAGSAGQGHAEP